MLTVHSVAQPGDKEKFLNEFDPATRTWLVSDLKSKFELQTRLLARVDALADHAVMRASELWRQLAWRLKPDWRVVSPDFIRALYQREFEQYPLAWARGPQAARTMCQLMPQFFPMLSQVPQAELVREWLNEHPASLLRWGHWFELANTLWQKLQEHRVIPSTWLPALLLDDTELTGYWRRPLIIDLSAQFTDLEAALIRQLSETVEIHVLAPDPKWGSAFRDSLSVYRRLGPKSEFAAASSSAKSWRVAGEVKRRRFATALAEVKDAVATCRAWLENGVAPEKIAIVAPDIELYWPLLAPSLSEEGIGVNKSRSVRPQGLKSIQVWLARMRLEMGLVQTADLELVTYSGDKPTLSYDRFRRLFTYFYDRSQLKEEERLEAQFRQTLTPERVLSSEEFLAAAAARWSDVEDVETLKRVLKPLLEESPSHLHLSTRLWLDWFEASLGHPRLELTIEAGEPGLQVVNVLAAEWLPSTHLYMLGLSEEALREYQVYGLNAIEISQLGQDLGVTLPQAEHSTLEFEARWLMERPALTAVMSCAAVDMAGSPLTPSRFWLLQDENPGAALREVEAPGLTRWDELQRASLQDIAQVRQWENPRAELLVQAVRQDLGLAALAPFGAELNPSLSASNLEKYAECPFIFAATKLFKLSDEPALDLDLDHFSRGRLMHALFEQLTMEPRRWNWTDAELSQLIDDLRERCEIVDRGLWAPVRARHVELARRFLAAEKKWLDAYPATKTVARELAFRARWSRELGKLVPDGRGEKTDPLVNGRIDRVDSDGQGEYVVLDYKSSAVDTRGIDAWVNAQKFQLALYAQAVEEGLTSLTPGLVRGAQFYIAKDLTRSKGFHLEGESRLLPHVGTRASRCDKNKREAVFAKINERVGNLIEKISGGKYAPEPSSIKNCEKCQWRPVCRAPHLS